MYIYIYIYVHIAFLDPCPSTQTSYMIIRQKTPPESDLPDVVRNRGRLAHSRQEILFIHRIAAGPCDDAWPSCAYRKTVCFFSQLSSLNPRSTPWPVATKGCHDDWARVPRCLLINLDGCPTILPSQNVWKPAQVIGKASR